MKKLILLLFLLLPAVLLAQNVSERRAQTIAEEFFMSAVSDSQTRAITRPKLQMVWNGESKTVRSASAPAFYVFNNESGRGFVIVSGEERTSTPILAYAFDQHFDAESMPDNLANWMKGIRSEINGVRAASTSASVGSSWDTYQYDDRQPIKLLNTALWDQRDPYNSRLPLGYVTGCPATAIAIIMRYHRWPEKGVGTIPESNDKIGAIRLGHIYDWDNMPLSYNDSPTDYQKDQVGILMRDVGAMIRTQYGGGTAGARPEETLPQLMPIYMRYDAKTIRSLFKRDFAEKDWHELLQKELDEERPVLYGGYSSGGGHQFVLDGYAKDHYYHVNWGWSGVSNGYYLLTVMNPPEQGTGGSSSADGFTKNQDAIIGIQPDPSNPGGGYFDLMAYKPYAGEKPYGMLTSETEFSEGATFSVDLKEFQNKGSRAFAGQLAIGHYSADGLLKGIISSRVIDYRRYPQQINDFTEGNFKCTLSHQIEPGDYICGVFKYNNPSTWTPIRNGYLHRDNCIEQIIIREGPREYVVSTTASTNFTGRAIATFSSEVATVPSHPEVEAFWAEGLDGETVVLRKIQPQGTGLVIPANTGVVLSTPTAQTITMKATGEMPAEVGSGNLFQATGDQGVQVDGSVNAYILAKKSGQLLFHRLSSSDRQIAANRAYLVLPTQLQGNSLKFVLDETSGIDDLVSSTSSAVTVYDLSGRIVSRPSRGGIYISNRKKFIIK